MLKIEVSLIGAFFSEMFGQFDALFTALLIFIIMDYLTGVMKAITLKKLSSNVGFKGIFKKILIIFMIAIARQLDLILNDAGIRYLVLIFYIVNEGISIIENASVLGLPIPAKIKDTLENLKNTDLKWFVLILWKYVKV